MNRLSLLLQELELTRLDNHVVGTLDEGITTDGQEAEGSGAREPRSKVFRIQLTLCNCQLAGQVELHVRYSCLKVGLRSVVELLGLVLRVHAGRLCRNGCQRQLVAVHIELLRNVVHFDGGQLVVVQLNVLQGLVGGQVKLALEQIGSSIEALQSRQLGQVERLQLVVLHIDQGKRVLTQLQVGDLVVLHVETHSAELGVVGQIEAGQFTRGVLITLDREICQFGILAQVDALQLRLELRSGGVVDGQRSQASHLTNVYRLCRAVIEAELGHLLVSRQGNALNVGTRDAHLDNVHQLRLFETRRHSTIRGYQIPNVVSTINLNGTVTGNSAREIGSTSSGSVFLHGTLIVETNHSSLQFAVTKVNAIGVLGVIYTEGQRDFLAYRGLQCQDRLRSWCTFLNGNGIDVAAVGVVDNHVASVLDKPSVALLNGRVEGIANLRGSIHQAIGIETIVKFNATALSGLVRLNLHGDDRTSSYIGNREARNLLLTTTEPQISTTGIVAQRR